MKNQKYIAELSKQIKTTTDLSILTSLHSQALSAKAIHHARLASRALKITM